ncbi:TonB family C-terminal domain-containing protein [Chitinophaga costaii]|uniref:TonB family C-terminal domain-containing protein n=1 Tax=Chitinophaga costaii TaxID=1335309 RepID=A0A1C4D6U8_9BACT|nr:energy transducer TonB [Chitinophaga costaii]PUZ24482.1 energy transducer TonB [Chitinophaga costaii]SCC27062.1 TonB family C-terminal domain-containing protein [Chitinophaga costaii]
MKISLLLLTSCLLFSCTAASQSNGWVTPAYLHAIPTDSIASVQVYDHSEELVTRGGLHYKAPYQAPVVTWMADSSATFYKTPDGDTIFVYLPYLPTFPGGQEALLKYFSQELHYPKMAADNGIVGTLRLQFVVTAQGNIRDLKYIGQPTGGGLEEEAFRVIKRMPHWLPGTVHGHPVAVQVIIPLHIDPQE